ncbi:MAG: glycosyl hydrolase 53 family protein [Promethearchaeota archaeon]
MNSSNFFVIEEKLANQKIENKNSLNSKRTIASSFASILVPSDFIFGADLSSYPQVIDGGGIYKNYTQIPANLFDLIKPIGIRWGRLRLWVDPPEVANSSSKYCNLEHIKAMASLFSSQNISYLLDFHYSDWWADPGQQYKPKNWNNLSFSELLSQVYNYTYFVLEELAEIEALPSMIQTGNEISHGMLWPDGNLANLTQFAMLLNISRFAVKDFYNEHQIPEVPIMIHIPANDWDSHRWFFDSLFELGVECDIIGLSYYPRWHGNITNLNWILKNSTLRYHIPIIIAETNYVHGLYWINPETGKYWNEEDVLSEFPASPEGQRAFLETLIHLMIDLTEGLGKGIILWEPAWIYPCVGSTPTQDRGFFDLDDSLLSVYSIPLVRYSFESNYTNTSSNNSTHFTSTFIAGYPILLNFLSIPLAITIIIIKKELWWNY